MFDDVEMQKMSHAYLLTGKPRVGKTRTIKQIIEFLGRNCVVDFIPKRSMQKVSISRTTA
jgi:hypothetical protein